MQQFKISVATAFGVESVTKNEIMRLGMGDNPAIDGRIQLSGDWQDIARLNINLRTAERVYIIAAAFEAITFDMLFEAVKKVQWERFFSPNSLINVVAKSINSKLFSLSAIQSITKKAIVERLKQAHKTSILSECGDSFTLEVAVKKDVVTLSLDTSGTALHKRGYRDLTVAAPIKETLAAALVMLSTWKYDLPLVDPFCGSGTIAIEAAMLANNIAPNLEREFAFSSWQCYPQQLLEQQRQAARSNITQNKLTISGFDIDSNNVSIATHHAQRAGVKQFIHFQAQDALDLKSSKHDGTIITNPPYGQRLSDSKNIATLYKCFSNTYKQLPNWNCCIISPLRDLERIFSKNAAKKRKFFNANIECWYYVFTKSQPKH